jgi:hypothetical protein
MHALRAAALLLFSAAVAAAGAEQPRAEQPAAPPDHSFIERLPRSWCGVFRWRGDDQDQHYTLAFTSVTRRASGTIDASGPGRNRIVGPETDPTRTIETTVRAVIDPVTRRVEIWERTATDLPNYDTTEPFVGTLAEDLQSMRMISRWSKDPRLLGDIVFHARPARAGPDEPCGAPSS